MKKYLMHFVIGGAAVFVLGIILLIAVYFSISNGEIRMRNRIAAQQNVSKVTFDNTWKIIKEKGGVSESYKEAFGKIYPEIMSTRNSGSKDGSLMRFVQESNPHFDISLYKDLSNSIETQRTIFTNEQKKLLDLKNTHDSMLDTFPGSLILAGRPKVDIKLVTSSRTESAFDTGKDDELLIK